MLRRYDAPDKRLQSQFAEVTCEAKFRCRPPSRALINFSAAQLDKIVIPAGTPEDKQTADYVAAVCESTEKN